MIDRSTLTGHCDCDVISRSLLIIVAGERWAALCRPCFDALKNARHFLGPKNPKDFLGDLFLKGPGIMIDRSTLTGH